MQVTETKTEGLKRGFSVVVPAALIEEKVTARLVEVGQSASIPGFRPGKIPMQVLRQRFQPAVMGEVLEAQVNESTATLVKDNELRPAVQPDIKVVTFEDGKDLEFTVDMEVLPKIEIGDLSKISLERLKAHAPDEDVEKALENLAKNHATPEPIKRKRKSRAGDIVTIDFLGKLDGVAFPGGEGKDFDLELGSGTFIPGFEDQLIGFKPEEDVEVKVTFPEQYHAAELAGKEVVFECTVKEIKTLEVPEIDDELAKKEGLEDLAALKEAIRGKIEGELDGLARQHLKRALLDALDETHKFDVPEVMLNGEFDAIWRNLEEAKSNGTLDPADVEKSEDDLKTEYKAIAERRVRLGLLLAEIGNENKVQVGKEDLQKAIMDQARQFPGQEREVFEYFTKTPQALEQLQAPLFEEKTVDFILELATVSEKEVTPAELVAGPDGLAEAEKDAE